MRWFFLIKKLSEKIEKIILGKLKKCIYYKHFRGPGKLLADKNCILIFDKDSIIEINKILNLNNNSVISNKRSSLIRLDKNAKFVIESTASIFYDADIVVFDNGKLVIGNSFINSNCKIRCHDEIKIGNGCAISHDFTVMDSDAHYIFGDKHTKPVVIEDNVWIGTRVTILSGVTVGEGAIIAAGSVVKENVPKKTLVAGVPAKVIKRNVEWSK